MANLKTSSTYLFHLLLLVPLVLNCVNADPVGLKVGFYNCSCPNAEAITKTVVEETLAVAPSLSGPLLRLFFHDCFVRGCDASILLDSPTNQAEKNAIPNLSLRGFDIIDRVKTALEDACPNVVSCADIIAFVSRDVVVADGGLYWYVESGRRDGLVSQSSEALANLPPPFDNISGLKTSFQQKGLSIKDLAVLSGAHTIGTSHCSSFLKRLYNFTGQGNQFSDPSMDPNYVEALRKKCLPNGPDDLVFMDPGSNLNFDQHYYKLVSQRRGLFQSDAALLDDDETRAYVESHKNGNPTAFFTDFGVSMVNMGRIGVLTGTEGQVRKVCSMVNNY